jgi:hypothetical protein
VSSKQPHQPLRLVAGTENAEPNPKSKRRGAPKGCETPSKPAVTKGSADPTGPTKGRKSFATIDRDLDRVSGTKAPKRVEVSLGQIAPLLSDALRSGRCWLQDFSDDTVSIDSDLYEILLAYAKLRRRDAA